jgi:hypothetical protein
MARTKTTARLTRRAQQLVKRAASMGGEEVVLRFHPQHDIARADQDGSDEEYEVCVHGGAARSRVQIASDVGKAAGKGVGVVSLALVGITCAMIVILQLFVLINEIWGSGRPLPPPAFIRWETLRVLNDYVPTTFLVPRPIVAPMLSTVCSDEQMVKFIKLAARDNVDGAVLTDFVSVARDVLGHARAEGCAAMLTLEQVAKLAE